MQAATQVPARMNGIKGKGDSSELVKQHTSNMLFLHPLKLHDCNTQKTASTTKEATFQAGMSLQGKLIYI